MASALGTASLSAFSESKPYLLILSSPATPFFLFLKSPSPCHFAFSDQARFHALLPGNARSTLRIFNMAGEELLTAVLPCVLPGQSKRIIMVNSAVQLSSKGLREVAGREVYRFGLRYNMPGK
jgi:hypothetical protein